MSEGQPEETTPPTEQEQSPAWGPQDANHPSNSRALAAAAEAAGLNSDSERPSTKEAIAGLMHDFEHRFDDPDTTPEPKEVVVPINDEPQEPGANHVDDTNHTAEAMAYAEGDFRTKGVENRKAFGPPSKTAARAREIEARLRTSDLGRIERFRLEKKLGYYNRSRHITNDYRKTERAWSISRDRFMDDFPDVAKDPQNLYLLRAPDYRAEYYDQQASRIGDWAGLLHDHPLSVDFKKAHPGVQFQPKGLVRMEDEAAAMEEEIERLEQEDDSIIGNALIEVIDSKGSYRDAVLPEYREISRMLNAAGEEKLYEEWNAIENEVVGVAEKFATFRTRLVRQVKIPDLRNELAVKRNLLNDVRRAVGLDVKGDEAEAVAQDQSHEELSTDTTPDQPQTE